MPPVHIVMVVICHKWCDNKKLWKIKIRVVVKQVFKVIWRKATLLHWIVYTLQWVSMFPSPWCPFPCWVCTPISYKVPMLTQVCTPVASWFYAAHPCAQLADTQTTLCAIRRKRPFVSMHFVWVMWPSKIISLDFFTCFFMRLPVAGGIMFFSLSIHLAVDFYFCFLPTWRYVSASTSYGPVSVSVSVHLSQVSVLSKQIDGIIWFLARRLPLASLTLCFKAIQVSKK